MNFLQLLFAMSAKAATGGGGGGGGTPTIIIAGSGASTSGAATTAALDTTGAKEIWATGNSYNSGSTATITDSKGNIWQIQNSGGTVIDSGSPALVHVYKTNAAINGGPLNVGTGHTFSSTSDTSFGSTVLIIAIGPGAGGTLSSTALSFTSDNTSPHTSSSVDPTPDNALLVAFGYHNGTGNPVTYDWSGSSFIEQCFIKDASNYWTGSIAALTVNAAGGFTASFTSSGSPTTGVIALIAVTEA